MKKLVLTTLALLLSTLAAADSNITARVEPFDPVYPVIEGRDVTFYSYHEYSATNRTSAPQHMTVCYELLACHEYEQYLRNNRECIYFDLSPGETKIDHKTLTLKVNYNFEGWCSLIANTEVDGMGYKRIADEERFYVRK